MIVHIDLDQLTELAAEGRTNEQLAAHFGVSVRTLQRKRAADPTLNQAILQARESYLASLVPEHGTLSRYRRDAPPSVPVLIEQAIARGLTTAQTMALLSVDYEQVYEARERLGFLDAPALEASG